VDWALDIAQIPPTTRESRSTIRYYAILVLTGGEMSTDGLYPKIKEICNSRIKTFVYQPYLQYYFIPPYLAMELLRGVTISVVINSNQINVKKASEKPGSWRYPIPNSPDQWLRQTVIAVEIVE